MGNEKVILLFSGGIDSTVLLFWLLARNYDVYPLCVNYGQNSFEGEFRAVNRILDGLKNYNRQNLLTLEIPALQFIGRGSLVGEFPQRICSREEWYASEFFPNRNMILLSLAAAYGYKLQAFKIAIGVVGISYQDTSKIFLDQIDMILEQSLAKFTLIAPFVDMPRQKVIEEAAKLHVPIEHTFSCNATGGRHCLLCTSCYEREEALMLYEQISKKGTIA